LAATTDSPGPVSKLLDDAARRVRVLLEEARRYAAGPSAEEAGLTPARHWRGNPDRAALSFRTRLQAALRLPHLERYSSAEWPSEAQAVLPAGATPAKETPGIWGTVLAWCSLEALGLVQDPIHPQQAAAELFDGLHLREPMAECFATLGLAGEDRWRAAARVRAAFAHCDWAPGLDRDASRPTAPYSWLHDPDVAWVIGVHEHEGVRYFNKEQYERLLWWMALRALLTMAEQPRPDPEKLYALERQLQARATIAAQGGYRVEALLESSRD
jgi:hypothetical protein